jgi:hypothetical protein
MLALALRFPLRTLPPSRHASPSLSRSTGEGFTYSENPPSNAMLCPVMHFACSEARKAKR